MNSKDLGGILDKINELRALFIFGQRVIPFLEELFYFVNDIIPVLEEINVSIYESANKMPRASSQLNKVSQATELATTEILDSLDSVVSRLNAIDTHFDTATSDLTAIGKLDEELQELVTKSMGGDCKDDMRKFAELNSRKNSHLKAVKANADGLEQSLKDIRSKANDIMFSLQVQDITAQQIASVNHLIESVQSRLSGLIERFNIDGTELVGEIEKLDKKAFNPDASYDHSADRQHSADEIMNRAHHLKSHFNDYDAPNQTESTSQDEIDRMFGKDEQA